MGEFDQIQDDFTENEPAYVYCVVREDMPAIHKAVQAGHACLEAGYKFERASVDKGHNTHLILLGVRNKQNLECMMIRLRDEGIRFAAFIEGFNDIGLTAIATEPVKCGVSRTLKKLNLLVIE